MPMSISTTSGACSPASRTASSPSRARPTTSKRLVASRASRSRARRGCRRLRRRGCGGARSWSCGACHSARLRCGSDHRRPQRSRAAALARRDVAARRSRRARAAPTSPAASSRCTSRRRPFRDPTEIPYVVPLPEPIPFDEAARIADELFDVAVRRCPCDRASSVDDFVEGEVTAIVHLEGAEAIAPDLSNLEDVVRARPPLDRARLVAPERVRRGRAVRVPGVAGHRAGPDRRRARSSCARATSSGSSSTCRI